MVSHDSITCCKTEQGRRLCAMQAHLRKVLDDARDIPDETLRVIGDSLEMEYVETLGDIRRLVERICERRDAIEAELLLPGVAA